MAQNDADRPQGDFNSRLPRGSRNRSLSLRVLDVAQNTAEGNEHQLSTLPFGSAMRWIAVFRDPCSQAVFSSFVKKVEPQRPVGKLQLGHPPREFVHRLQILEPFFDLRHVELEAGAMTAELNSKR